MAIKDIISDPNKEWTQMGFYNARLDSYQNERDMALSEGDINKFYRVTLALMANVTPNFRRKDIEEKRIKLMWDAVFNIGNKIKSLSNLSDKAKDLNKLKYEEELVIFNEGLMDVMHEIDMIFPHKKVRDPKKSSRAGMFMDVD